MLSEKLNTIILSIGHQSALLNAPIKELAAQSNDPHHRTDMLNSDGILELLRGIRDGISNETNVMHEMMTHLVQGMDNQSDLLNEKLSALALRSNSRVAIVGGPCTYLLSIEIRCVFRVGDPQSNA